MTQQELMHYGVLGQKWGVRRYQNEDGTLTAAGRRRYGSFDTKGYKQSRKQELDAKGYTGPKQAALINNEAYILKASDKKVRKSLIKQEKLDSKIKDAIELKDAKQLSKLTKKWVNQQANIRYDEILQNKENLESYAKAFIKYRMSANVGGAAGALTVGKGYIELVSDYSVQARNKALRDAEEYKNKLTRNN